MKELFCKWNAAIAPQDTAAMARAKARWDGIAKPLDGLGKLETAVVRIAGITGSEAVSLDRRTVLVLCADNGVVKEGVTQTDASVTATMAQRISEHRSSVCLMAKTARADVIPVDLGMLSRVPGVRDLHVDNGTANMAEGPAMTEAQAIQALEVLHRHSFVKQICCDVLCLSIVQSDLDEPETQRVADGRKLIVFGDIADKQKYDSVGEFLNKTKIENHFFKDMLDIF